MNGKLTRLGSEPLTAAMTVIEIRPHSWGWKVFEAPGVEPVFPEKRQAINYAENRAWFRSGEICILDSTGNLERSILFSELGNKAIAQPTRPDGK